MTKSRPCPPDFLKVAERLRTRKAVMEHFKCGDLAFMRWSDETGFKLDKAMAPDDLAERAQEMGIARLARHYGVTTKVMIRMLRDAGIKAKNDGNGKRRYAPDDFAEKAREMTNSQLADHYDACGEIVRRWAKETGVTVKKQDARSLGAKAAATRLLKRAAKSPPRKPRHYAGPVVTDIRKYHNDVYDMAADKLRRYCPVHRCDEKGVYQQAGNFWRVGWSILTPDELLDKARKMEKAA